MEANPDFEFRFTLESDIVTQTAENDSSAIFAKSAIMQVQLENWADFVVYLAS